MLKGQGTAYLRQNINEPPLVCFRAVGLVDERVFHELSAVHA